ncbi:MAG: metal-dependent transcriptional regulator [Deltaproteobacteria bacterium]|jgi:DtxR family Mn-dependent transcriptional regulator|nr:metal-dependent transcriptional regulator [Deltaproteobacteria bacterium]NTV56780.1 metal-dependent transcriptional regulator [Deltaproteobacteria bacterium]
MAAKTNLTSQMEDYLEAIYHLCRDEGVARVKAIADRLEVTTPSVVGAIRKLKDRNLVIQEPYGYVRLTMEGEEIGGAISHNHEVLSDFLKEILGLDHETASVDACKIEHAVSAETVRRLRAVAEFIRQEPQINVDWEKEFKRFYREYLRRL